MENIMEKQHYFKFVLLLSMLLTIISGILKTKIEFNSNWISIKDVFLFFGILTIVLCLIYWCKNCYSRIHKIIISAFFILLVFILLITNIYNADDKYTINVPYQEKPITLIIKEHKSTFSRVGTIYLKLNNVILLPKYSYCSALDYEPFNATDYNISIEQDKLILTLKFSENSNYSIIEIDL